MKRLLIIAALALFSTAVFAQGYKVGDKATDFKLKNVNGKQVSMADYKSAKGYIVVFTCNHCPYAKAYENRIIALDKKYAVKGYPVIAINPNDPVAYPEDSFDNMKKRSTEKKYSFPYLIDESQNVAKAYGATKTPHVFILQKTSAGDMVEYIGAIDNDTEGNDDSKIKYVENAVDALLQNKKPETTLTKAVGCSIKWKSI
ncbi:thioredoxin family protein [Solitalea canadensis]|uniref:Peroxiredoxin n=1 Tax=Solitalea canadensis (strain ATCC 29591 / DSM 3403 / JCM 21819 / LMG 8368 / NBRC 15130 / NCIMB 12057 / USAM 9D) TaxID=929556 RepID=H8KTH0_SOLCM|nr:thioredoxin family protein [Solitalea canadensis]AFD06428.1 Peroxiredoxin [Solitalea canadensis DSM 3403]